MNKNDLLLPEKEMWGIADKHMHDNVPDAAVKEATHAASLKTAKAICIDLNFYFCLGRECSNNADCSTCAVTRLENCIEEL